MKENVKLVLDQWVDSLAQVIESMTDTRPQIEWKPMTGGPASDDEALWWEQSFQSLPEAKVWVVAPRAAWEPAGTFTLKAAGLETIELSEAHNTWIEILGQSLSAMAHAIGSVLGHEVNCAAGVERAPEHQPEVGASVEIRFENTTLSPITVLLGAQLAASLVAPPRVAPDSLTPEEPAPARVDGQPAKSSPTMELLLDIDLPVSISFGSAHLPLKDVVKLNTGSIVELDRLVGEPVDVLVNQRLIARGEVVVVEGNYGVRIQEIASHTERLRSVG